ncbi:MAG: sugar phosphate nucleotidyltransferase [bacterium]|nr:sugar phosphate nucleotidyltransferase [bacterium]
MNNTQTTTAVILAAGSSSRFWPLNGVHKGLSKLMGKPLLWYTLKTLREAGIEDVVLVQGVKRDIEKELGSSPLEGLDVRYVVQQDPMGTGAALRCALNELPEKFLVLYGDDLYAQADIEACRNAFPSLLALEVENPREFGVIVPKGDMVEDIIEKPEHPPSSLANIGMYHVPKDVFLEKTGISSRGEEELTDYIKTLAKRGGMKLIKASYWQPLSYAWSLLDACSFFMAPPYLRENQEVAIHESAVLGEGCEITGPCVIGPECKVGRGCILEGPLSLEEGVVVGDESEIRRSIIWKRSHIGKNCKIQDSVVAEDCVVGDNVTVESKGAQGLLVRLANREAVVKRERFGMAMGAGSRVESGKSLGPAFLLEPKGELVEEQKIYDNERV